MAEKMRLLPIIFIVTSVFGCGDGSHTTETGAGLEFEILSQEGELPHWGPTSGAVYVDLDGDGMRDILLGRHDLAPEAYINQGGCRFRRWPEWDSGLSVFDHHATVADYIDGNESLDFYFVVGAHRGKGIGPNALYLNKTAESNNIDQAAALEVNDPFGRGRGGLVLDPDYDSLANLFVLNFRTAPRCFEFNEDRPTKDDVESVLGIRKADDHLVAEGTDRRRTEFITNLLPIDIAEDGWVDYVAIGGGLPLKVLRADSASLSLDIPTLPFDAYMPAPVEVVQGDFDGDLHPDIVLLYGRDDRKSHFRAERQNRLLIWNDGHFVERPSPDLSLRGNGTHAAVADFDNSGALDLAVCGSDGKLGHSWVRLFLNDGYGTLMSTEAGDVPAVHLDGIADGILAEDLDYDGDIDLVVLLGAIDKKDPGGGVAVMRNLGARGHWISFVFDGTFGADVYGTIVTVRCGDRIQRRQYWPTQVGGSSYRADLRFGVGDCRQVDEVILAWPNGQTSRLNSLAVDRTITVPFAQ
ncbi:hypothetical protein GF314_02605 [bacterium]|nr:hypothetical protein [bacterium]